MVKNKIDPEVNRLGIISFSLGILLPLMFALTLFRSRFVNNVGMLYFFEDIICGMIPVGLTSLITGWISLARSKEFQNPRLWMPITGIILGALALLWLILGTFHSVLGIGPSE
jgi:hypothetical protein